MTSLIFSIVFLYTVALSAVPPKIFQAITYLSWLLGTSLITKPVMALRLRNTSYPSWSLNLRNAGSIIPPHYNYYKFADDGKRLPHNTYILPYRLSLLLLDLALAVGPPYYHAE